jgi:hypothetical protein
MRRLIDEPKTRDRLASGARVSVEAQLSGALEKWTDAVFVDAVGRDCRMPAARL